MPIPTLIADKQIQMTSSQSRAAQYITDHYDEAIFMTASKLARQVGVSEATIVRLAQVLGFDGYPAMQRMLREKLQERLTTVTRLEKSVQNVRNDGDVLTKVMQEDIRNLSQTLQEISLDTFHKAVVDMKSAKMIYVVGMRRSRPCPRPLPLPAFSEETGHRGDPRLRRRLEHPSRHGQRGSRHRHQFPAVYETDNRRAGIRP